MPRPVVCPHCRAELDIPPEFRDREVRCSECRNVFVPPSESASPARRPDRDDDRPTRRPGRDDRDDDFQGRDRDPYADRDLDDRRPRRRRPNKSGSMKWLWILIIGGIGFVVLSCGGCVAFGLYIESPDLQPYTAPDGRFKVMFPGKPASRTETTDGGQTRTCVESHRDILTLVETWFVYYVDLTPKPTGLAVDAALRSACDEYARKNSGSRELSRTPTTYDGLQGMDLQLEHLDGNATMVRFLLDGRRLYSVGITGSGLDPQSNRLAEFWNSFKSLAPPPDPKK